MHEEIRDICCENCKYMKPKTDYDGEVMFFQCENEENGCKSVVNPRHHCGLFKSVAIKPEYERCKNCVHMIPTKHMDNGVWKWFYICCVFANEKNGWAITVTPDDWCEMFVRKEKQNDNFTEKV